MALFASSSSLREFIEIRGKVKRPLLLLAVWVVSFFAMGCPSPCRVQNGLYEGELKGNHFVMFFGQALRTVDKAKEYATKIYIWGKDPEVICKTFCYGTDSEAECPLPETCCDLLRNRVNVTTKVLHVSVADCHYAVYFDDGYMFPVYLSK
ncbi:hypothetical protein FOL47_010242 [Perkinsus chesapeaki]|uniref:Uncharacterized protein n=1 Tax=Perkinsus chesapeaki TaxID=330153 RepID=A0A7J6MPY2_PERCH|nr:hypothetical protein FOL47_010242 [Perkinsus chesapeaki]